ncbi:MAG: bifunctional nuclease family protein [Chloroflexota bacterium]
MVEMVVESIGVDARNHNKVVILREREKGLYLPIWIGSSEADAIAVKLHDVELPRPMTHDLLKSVIESLGASVRYISVNSLEEGTFFAKVYLEVDGGDVQLDSRPSDAIALAVRAGVPVYAEEALLNEAGVVLENQPAGEQSEAPPQQGPGGAPEDLGAFEEFIKTLPLEELGGEHSREGEPVRDRESGEPLIRPEGYTGRLHSEVTDEHRRCLKALADAGEGDFVAGRTWLEECERQGVETQKVGGLSDEMVYGVFASRGWIELGQAREREETTYRITAKGKRYLEGSHGDR